MILLYTFDIPENDKLTKLTMLRLSIHSVLRELNEHIEYVYIYSNNHVKLKTELNYLDSRIKVLKIPKYITKVIASAYLNDMIKHKKLRPDIESHYRVINGKVGIAHSRVFLLNKIMQKHKSGILYLDYDTGIKRNDGLKLLQRLLSSNVITDLKTDDSIPENLLKIYPKFELSKLPKYISWYAVRWGCGYFYISYSRGNLRLTREFKIIYKKLISDIGFMDSHDEYAIGIALKKHEIYPESLYENKTFFTTKSSVLLHSDFGESPSIVHYVNQKDNPKFAKRLKKWISDWAQYFEKNGEEPRTLKIDYSVLRSIDFIGGRFEEI
jgi:hypothetical protein